MYSPVLTLLTVFIVLISCVQGAVAEVVTKCSGAKGQSYYMYNSQPLIAGIKKQPQFKEGGWVEEDIMKDGVFYLERKRIQGEVFYDVLYHSKWDREERRENLKDSGMSLAYSGVAQNGAIVISAVNAKDFVSEHYTFKLDSQGNGRMVFNFIQTSHAFPKASIYVAECVVP